MLLANSTTTIIIIVVVAIVGAIIAFYMARFMKGNIKMTLSKTSFSPGEKINGSFVLLTKKQIESNQLVVSLIGIQVTKTRDNDGKLKTRSDEVFRDQVVVEEAKSYGSGEEQSYDFELDTPSIGNSEFANSKVGHALLGAIKLLSDRSTKIKWKLEARLDAKGVDLVDSRSVNVSMKA